MSNGRKVYQDLPDDFFNELAEESFIGGVVLDRDDDPHLNRCLEEIKQLERKIEKKRQVIKERQDGLTSEQNLCHSVSRSRSRERERRHRERRRRSTSRSRSPHSSSKHARYEDRARDRDRRYVSPLRNRPDGRPIRRSRSRSKSPHRSKRSSSTHRNISFLEELAQKFAEKGQAFPEKDALMMGQNQMNNNAIGPNGVPMPMDFGNVIPFDQPMIQQSMVQQPMVQQPMIQIPNFQPQQVAYPMQQGMNLQYGINPMSILAGNAVQPQNTGNMAPFPGLSVQPDIPAMGMNAGTLPVKPVESILSDSQKASIINRCEQAIKLIRAKDNKVPIMKFHYNRTSLVVSNLNDAVNLVKKSPLYVHSNFNPAFKINAPPNVPVKTVNGLKMLPSRVKDVARSLSIKSSFLFEKMRTKELNAQIVGIPLFREQ